MLLQPYILNKTNITIKISLKAGVMTAFNLDGIDRFKRFDRSERFFVILFAAHSLTAFYVRITRFWTCVFFFNFNY